MADTRHLSTLEHGAYMLLIMHYWQAGSLPNDEARLSRIAGLTSKEWKYSRNTLYAFFEEGWRHRRVKDELVKAEELSSAGRIGGLASGVARRAKQTIIERPLNGSGNDPPTKGQPLPSHSPSQLPKINLSCENGEAKGWTPPRHGATSTNAKRVYIEKRSTEWEAYAGDYRSVHFRDPEPNKHGGKWFKTLGEGHQ